MLLLRYIFRELAGPSVLGLLIWTSIFLVDRFFRLADQWVKGALDFPDVLKALLFFLPSTLVQTVPMSVLLGILIGFARLSADSEVTAMRAMGVSYYRLLVPTIIIAVLGWASSAALYIWAVPWGNTSYVEFVQQQSRLADVNREIRPGTWAQLQGAALFARGLDQSDPNEPWLLDVDILVSDPLEKEREHWRADRMRIERLLGAGGRGRLQFHMEDVRTIAWHPDDPSLAPKLSQSSRATRTGPARVLPANARVSDRKIQRSARLKSLAELRQTTVLLDQMDHLDVLAKTAPKEAAERQAAMGRDWILPQRRDWVRRITWLEIYKKYSIPTACIVFALAGMPLGIATRRGGRPASFLISIGVIMLWWMIYSGSEAWVQAGRLSPAAGAWMPNVGLALVAAFLLVKLRRQQQVGAYRALRDMLLISSLLCFLLALGLGLEYLRSTSEDRTGAPVWPLASGVALLVLHVLVVIFRDAVSRTLARLVEAFRRPRNRDAPDASEASDEPAIEAVTAAPAKAPMSGRVHRLLERLRGHAIIAFLAVVVFAVLQVFEHEDGLRAGAVATFTDWPGAALLGLGLVCAILQALGVPVIKTLDWWVLTAYFRVLALVLGSLFVLYGIFRYLELADEILQNEVALPLLGDYFLRLLPQIFFEMIPLAAMVSALVVFGVMTKFNETTAVRCGGVSVFRLVLPVVVVGGLLSCVSFVLHDYVMPQATAEADELKETIRGTSQVRRGRSRGYAVAEGGDALYQYERLLTPKAGQPRLLGLTVLRFNPRGERVRELLVARDAEWVEGRWLLRRGWRAGIADDREVDINPFDERPGVGMEDPDYFAAERDEPDEMTFLEFRRFVELQEGAGYPTGEARVQLHRKLAFPAATLVLVLVGLPFAFMSGRRGALYGMGVSVIVAVLYYAAMAIFAALGSAEYLPAVVAAWAPNALFGVGGVYLMLHVRT